MSKYEQDRNDGHTILLMEVDPEKRTFSDYPDERTCLDTIVNMYEEEKSATGQEGHEDLSDDEIVAHFMEWLDSFYSIQMLVFDKSISRYRLSDREALKNKFERNPEYQTETVTVKRLVLPEIDSESVNHWDE